MAGAQNPNLRYYPSAASVALTVLLSAEGDSDLEETVDWICTKGFDDQEQKIKHLSEEIAQMKEDHAIQVDHQKQAIKNLNEEMTELKDEHAKQLNSYTKLLQVLTGRLDQLEIAGGGTNSLHAFSNCNHLTHENEIGEAPTEPDVSGQNSTKDATCMIAYLREFASLSDEQSIGKMMDIGEILTAMGRYQSNVDMQEQGLLVLRNLAYNNPGNKIKIVSESGIDIILEAMQRHTGRAVQEYGCDVLMHLSRDPDIVSTVVRRDSVEYRHAESSARSSTTSIPFCDISSRLLGQRILHST